MNEPSAARTAIYALPQVAVAFVTLGLLNYAPAFYGQERGLDLGLISVLVLLSRLTDVITDPLVGGLSDRTRTRIGRRKPWLLAGLPLFVVSVWFLFRPPETVGAAYFFWWFSAAFLGITCSQLPYVSWGAELSADYDGRTRIAATREGIGLLGSIAALLVAIGWAVAGDASLGTVLGTMAVMLAVGMPLLVLLAVRFVPRGPLAADEERLTARQSAAAIMGNKPFLVFLFGVFVAFAAISPGGAMNYYLFDHVYGRADLQAFSVLGEFAAGIAALPLWNGLAGRIGKGRALASAFVWIGAFTCLVPTMGDAFGAPGAMAMAAIRALALGAVLSLPYAILADVVDVDTARTGRERTGLYMAIGGVVVKVTISIGISAAFAIPALAGFDPSVRTNDEAALASVAATFAYLPGVLFILAAPMFWFFPLGPEEVAANRAAIAARYASS